MLFRSPKGPLNILRPLTTGKIVTLLNYGSNDLEKERKLNWINRNHELRDVIFRKSDKTIIMEMFHDNKGHLGIEKTYS
jgi:hypothetical protein